MQQVLLSSLDRSKTVYVACSGGADSVALLHKLWTCKFNVKCLYVSHSDTEEDDTCISILMSFCNKRHIEFIQHPCLVKDFYKSNEQTLRDFRYSVFNQYKDLGIVVLGHHLDDQIETFVMSSMSGNPKLIPISRDGYIYRPLVLKTKKEILDYCYDNDLSFYTDPNNFNKSNLRSKIRLQLKPVLDDLFPNLEQTVKNMVRSKILQHLTYSEYK